VQQAAAEEAKPQPNEDATIAQESTSAAPALQPSDAESTSADLRDSEPNQEGLDESVENGRNRYFLGAAITGQAAPLLGVGGSLQFRMTLARPFAWSSAFSFVYAKTAIDRGELRASALSLRTGLAVFLERRPFTLLAGAGVCGQWLRLSGAPTSSANTLAASFDAWSLGPALFAGATWRVAPPLSLAFELDGSHGLRTVRALVQDGDARSLTPWRVSAMLGAGVMW
jgi:opacity protein-like surface antigen